MKLSQRSRQARWNTWLQGVTARCCLLEMSTGFIQITHSLPPSPVSMSLPPRAAGTGLE